MDIEKCKQCQLYHLDTLNDGNKEHYCYPPIMLGMMALSIPCENRGDIECKKILKHIEKHGYVLDLRK